jgi:tellurite resistance protein
MGLMDLFRRKDARTVFAPPTRKHAQPPRGAVSASALQWVPPGQPFEVAGRTITGGGVYVGRGARAAQTSIVEPALIDPSLKVDWGRPDLAGSSMGYWPAYSEISPGARAAYLSWLSAGREGPTAYIGYVFLYFYGLERRALLDAQVDPRHPDVPAIADEVRRLIGIYGTNGSFRSYASGFLALLEASTAVTANLVPPRADSLDRTWDVPFVVRVALGRYSAAGQPIPADWALLWLRSHPEAYLRTPASRCTDEFDELFRYRYGVRFRDGMVVKPPKATISLSYNTASAGFRGSFEANVGSIPDLARLSGPINKLKDLGSECTDALDSYSRYLGRHTDGAGTPGAIALLPDELLESYGGATVDSLREWARNLTATGPASLPLDDLVARWSPGRVTKLAKADAVAVGSLLGKLGMGIEPDVRFGASTPTSGSMVVLFALPPGATEAPSAEYAAAATLVHLAAVVASSDGSITDAERRHLGEHLEIVLGLDPAEQVRLEAHLLWLGSAKAGLGGLKKRIDALSQVRRAAVGQFLVDVAASDGLVTPDEITMLTKLYKLLGLEESGVYSAVHAFGTTDAGPVPLTTPGAGEVRWPIPPAADALQATVRLDPDRIRARLAETATVTALLADIFTEDNEPPAAPLPPAVPADAVIVAGLDAPHSALANRLRMQPSWDRPAVETIAGELGLPMLDAAIDRVNDAAIEACGEPLAEGDDPLEINDYAAEELF